MFFFLKIYCTSKLIQGAFMLFDSRFFGGIHAAVCAAASASNLSTGPGSVRVYN